MSANYLTKSEATSSPGYRSERAGRENRQPTGAGLNPRDTARKDSTLGQRPKNLNLQSTVHRSRATSPSRVPAPRPDAQHALPPVRHQPADREPPARRSIWEIAFVECLLVSCGFVVAGIVILAFGLDLLTGIPFHRHSLLMDAGISISAGILAYISWHAYRGLH